MVGQRIEKLAKLSVHYGVDVKPREKGLIQGTEQAFPLINELYKECLLSDAHPTVIPRLNLQYTFYKYAKPINSNSFHLLKNSCLKTLTSA